ncbi:flagellar hook protein FlgE [Pseudomonadales bacterium]|nr:flagellar hook protein FlgE [Pseudomonadales bacterium]
MAFDTSVSGILAASADLGIIGNNIANSSTAGFKSSQGEFTDIYAASLLGTPGTAIGQGVALNSVTQDFSQGNIEFTNNSLDLAINGSGFFNLSDGGVATYSRAGAFQLDRDGFIVNASGLQLQGYPTDDEGNLTGELGPLQLSTALVDPKGTGEASITANLDSRDLPAEAWNPDGAGGALNAFAVPPVLPKSDQFNSSTSLTVYDGLGNPHVLSIYFAKGAGENTWEARTAIDGVEIGGATAIPFEANGQLAEENKPLLLNIADWQPINANGVANGAAAQAFSVDLSSFTQFGASFAVSTVQQDGYTTGQLRGLEIDDTGVLFTRYTNGQSRQQGQIAVASFTNPNGLQPVGDTSFVETFSAGSPTITTPGLSGTGLLQSGALESSNVEITSQLVRMIIAQRNFQANAQMIQTEDAVTQTVINLR